MTSEQRVELVDGGYAIALTDQDGNVEITEYDPEGNVVQRTYGRVGEPRDMSYEEARKIVIPEGLTPQQESDWLYDRSSHLRWRSS